MSRQTLRERIHQNVTAYDDDFARTVTAYFTLLNVHKYLNHDKPAQETIEKAILEFVEAT